MKREYCFQSPKAIRPLNFGRYIAVWGVSGPRHFYPMALRPDGWASVAEPTDTPSSPISCNKQPIGCRARRNREPGRNRRRALNERGSCGILDCHRDARLILRSPPGLPDCFCLPHVAVCLLRFGAPTRFVPRLFAGSQGVLPNQGQVLLP